MFKFKKSIVLMFALCCSLGSAFALEHFTDFPIGVYSADPQTDENMELLKRSGFNYIHSYRSLPDEHEEILDLAQKHGIKVMLNLNRNYVKKKNGLELMRKDILRFKDHPALGMWYMYDEPSGKVTPEVLMPFYQMIKKEDPKTPVVVAIHWNETWDRYSSILDIQLADLYPVRDEAYPTSPLQTFSNFVGDSIRLGKPVIAVPQLMSWRSFEKHMTKDKSYDGSKFRYPNFEELRYFNFSAIAQGVHGIVGYSFFHAMRTGGNPKWWETTCAKSFNEVKEFVATVDNPSKPVRFKRAADANYFASYWKGKDGEYLVYVNAWPLERPRTGCYFETFFKKNYELIPWGNTRKVSAAIKNNKLQFSGKVAPWEVFIWKLKEITKEAK